jgi:DNA-binding beta-propeller fold protein YncE
MDARMRALAGALTALFVVATTAASNTTPNPASTRPRTTSRVARADCNAPPKDPIAFIDVRENVFQALPTDDGCWVFASLAGRGRQSNIAVLEHRDGTLKLRHTVPIAGNATGMVITHDGKLLIVADGPRVAFLDTQKLIDGRRDAVLGYLDEPNVLGRIYVNVTRDDRTLFVADENVQTITVVDLEKIRASNFKEVSIIGKIPTGAAPIALTFSNDEKYLFATSQVAPRDYGWPLACKREASNDPAKVNALGAIHVIDVERAKTDPPHSILRSIPTGCNSVRLVLSPSGDRAYVTARADDALLVFDTAKLTGDTAGALIARVTVGTSPVGIAVIDSGRKVTVTNSNRFGNGANDDQVLTVIDVAPGGGTQPKVLGTIQAGAFPREMRVASDGGTLFLTNFNSKTIEMIDVARLPLRR